jgi:hypothetical protein
MAGRPAGGRRRRRSWRCAGSAGRRWSGAAVRIGERLHKPARTLDQPHDHQPGTTTTVQVSTTTRPTTTTTHRVPTSTQSDSVLGRREQRPAGAAAFARFFAGGAGGLGSCGEFDAEDFRRPTVRVPGSYSSGPSARPDVGEFLVGIVDELCLFRFAPEAPIDVSVTSPIGTVKRLEGCTSCPHLLWFGLPGDPLGTYKVTAVQGPLEATGRFDLHAAQDPTLLVAESWSNHGGGVPRGSTIRIGVAGFRPNEIVKLLFYYAPKEDSNQGGYRTSVSLRMDAMGQRLYRLQTRLDDPKGFYAVRTLPAVDVMWRESELTFRLT